VMAELSGKPSIEVRGLRKEFDGVAAVEGLDLVVLEGEVFGLVGPDGAGKTTTMRMLSGALRPTGGAARVAGADVVEEAEEAKRRIGYLAQRPSLYAELTVDENVQFQARLRGVTGSVFERRRERLLSLSRLGRFRNRLAHELSGGMRQKLALACALIHEPEVLLLDEPTAGVDPVSRSEFWELLLELAGGGTTILMSTPYMEEAERCGRVGLLHGGRLLASGTPGEIKEQSGLELLEVACEPLSEGARAARRVAGVRWVEVFGDRLHAAAGEAREVRDPVREALERAGVRVAEVRQIAPGLEDAFFELVRRERGALE
jgi:ABC-2 type transport system ATP-binding protein